MADEPVVYPTLHRIIQEYGRSRDPWRQALALDLFAVRPGNVPFAPCWRLLKDIWNGTERLDHHTGLATAMCNAISSAIAYMKPHELDEAEGMLHELEQKFSPEEGHSQLMRRDEVLSLIAVWRESRIPSLPRVQC